MPSRPSSSPRRSGSLHRPSRRLREVVRERLVIELDPTQTCGRNPYLQVLLAGGDAGVADELAAGLPCGAWGAIGAGKPRTRRPGSGWSFPTGFATASAARRRAFWRAVVWCSVFLSFWTVASEPGETLATSTDPPRATRRPRLRGSLALRVAAAGAGAAYGGLLERFDRRVAGFLGCLESALGLG
jgi:hypothetical protein